MADNQGSARVTLREIDLSQVRDPEVLPQGVPAAVVGPAKRGPAFVPKTFANVQQFGEIFGSLSEISQDSNANRFGPLAINEWLRNSESGAYVRVLGIGDGDGTLSSDNKTTGAGFIVGNKLSSYNGTELVDNVYAAYESGPNAAASKTEALKVGRTHFLGCFMKDTSSSSFLKDAGLETAPSAAAEATITIADGDAPHGLTAGQKITLTSTDGTIVDYFVSDTSDGGAANLTAINNGDTLKTTGNVTATLSSNATRAIAVGFDLSGATTQNGFLSLLKGAIENPLGHDGKILVSVVPGEVDGPQNITLTQDVQGIAGNTTTTSDYSTITITQDFDGGEGGESVHVIRGLLMTPQGVKATLDVTDGTYVGTDSGTFDESSHLRVSVTSGGSLKNFGGAEGTHLAGYQLGKVSNNSFTVLLNGLKNDDQPAILTCSFDPESVNYFAKVLNTDPEKIEECGHCLYSHWDIDPAVAEVSVHGLFNNDGTQATLETGAFCLPTVDADPKTTAVNGHPVFEDFETRFRTAKSPWIISQKFGGQTKKLFRLHAQDDGAVANNRFRILLSDLRTGKTASDWSTFTLSLEAFDSDPILGEAIVSWKNLTLDPNSRNFIGRVLGNRRLSYSFKKGKLVEEGDFEIRNKYVWVELADEVLSGDIDVSTLPCGFSGLRTLNTNIAGLFDEAGTDGSGASRLLQGGSLDGFEVLPLPYVKSVTRLSGATASPSADLAWGIKFAKKENAGLHRELGEIRINSSIKSWTKFLPDMGLNDNERFTVESTEDFSLENISWDGSDWSSATYQRSGTALVNQELLDINAAASGLNVKYLKFRCIMQGGFDGLNIFNKEKAALSSIAAHREAQDELQDSTFTGPTVVSYQKAIDVLADKSATEIQLLAIPGIREPLVTDYAIKACESRFDAMLVMDIQEADRLKEVIVDDTKPHVAKTIETFEDRSLDTSFAAAYFPDVISRRSSNNTPIQVPPSVCMLGVMSQNDTLADPWFAPAGLTRGRLNASSAKVQMSRDLLNDLYDADINPIYVPAGRSNEVYAFGQKTLLQNQSALDRINVRRLLINIRRRVKAVANTLLFEPNRASTLAKFSALVEPIMSDVQARQGVERYKVQIDTSTTTQNDIENNTIRGKVYLQPTKSVEFISLDFVVTNSID